MPPFPKGQSGNPKGRPRGRLTFASMRKLLAAKEEAEFIRDQLKDLAEHAQDETVRREAALDLAKLRGDTLDPAIDADDDGADEPLTPEALAAALMPPTTETAQ